MEKLPTYDTRMIALMKWAIDTGLAKNESDYFEKISFARTNISNVRAGRQSFSRDHILKACQLTGANANWILGLESNMMRKPAKGAIDKLKEVIIELEAERNAKRNKNV